MNPEFKLSELKGKFKLFCETQIKPCVKGHEANKYLDPDLIKKMFQAGYMGLDIPESYFERSKGMDMSFAINFQGIILAIEEFSKVDPSVSVFLHVHSVLFTRILMQYGNDKQKSHWLPRIASQDIGAFAVTEPQAGSDLANMTVTAKKVSGGYLINGEKNWITNAREAAVFVLIAATQTDNGLSVPTAFLIERDTKGLSVKNNIDKLCMRASSTCKIKLVDVFVQESSILGKQTSGVDIVNYGLCMGRVGIASQMMGIAQGAQELALKYAKERSAFGDKIFKYQAVSFPLAQIATEVSVIRPFVYQLAKKVDQGYSYMKLIDDANKAKLFSSQLAERAVSSALEVFGGNGMAEEYDIERYYRNAKVGKIYEGTENVLLRSIASRLVNNPA